MKNLIIYLTVLLSVNTMFAQTNSLYKEDLPIIEVTKDVNLHFRSPEPVQFVDLSTDRLIGDIPIENVVRVKIQSMEQFEAVFNDTITKVEDLLINYTDNQEIGIVTIVGQSFMAQYKIVYRDNLYSYNVVTNIEIEPKNMKPLEFPSYDISKNELKSISMDIIRTKKNKNIRKEKKMKMVSTLNNIYTVGDYVFIDLSFYNKTNLSYDIDEVRFTIDDKKIYKSTNIQSNSIVPIYKLYNNKHFKRSFRNIYVFKKFSYPNNKILNVRLTEEQISGRTISLGIKYKDILQADTF